MRTVAALYIDPRGPYPKMEGVDCWDEERDATKYEGPHPVVAHPPCGPWGRLRHLYRGGGHRVAPLAVEQVRQWGGVLEHPSHSKLFAHIPLPRPGRCDTYGWTLAVEQVSWGHVARKPTWLYIVGVPPSEVEPRTGGEPTHWIGGGRKDPSWRPGIKFCSAQQRRRTPPAFAEWLVSLARAVDL